MGLGGLLLNKNLAKKLGRAAVILDANFNDPSCLRSRTEARWASRIQARLGLNGLCGDDSLGRITSLDLITEIDQRGLGVIERRAALPLLHVPYGEIHRRRGRCCARRQQHEPRNSEMSNVEYRMSDEEGP